jgi:glycosyltransferase involved in cell wall biosynthesis
VNDCGSPRCRGPQTVTKEEETRPLVAVVVAAYNEGDKIAEVVGGLRRVLPNSVIIVVDDGSTDNTFSVLRDLPAHRLSHAVNLGQGAALQTGIDYARRRGADYIVTFDGDGQHQPDDVSKVLAPLLRGDCDIALGSRFLDSKSRAQVPSKRRLLLRAAVLFTRLTTGLRLTDAHNGLRAFNARFSAKLTITVNGMAHASEILEQIAASNLRWQEVPTTVHYTAYSKAKGQKSSNMFNIVWELVRKHLKGR